MLDGLLCVCIAWTNYQIGVVLYANSFYLLFCRTNIDQKTKATVMTVYITEELDVQGPCRRKLLLHCIIELLMHSNIP